MDVLARTCTLINIMVIHQRYTIVDIAQDTLQMNMGYSVVCASSQYVPSNVISNESTSQGTCHPTNSIDGHRNVHFGIGEVYV
jgi:hypothetical protein